MKIFNLFKRKNDMQDGSENIQQTDDKNTQIRSMLETARSSLQSIEQKMFHLKDQHLFEGLMSFVAYYTAMIEFYTDHVEAILSVNDLLLFKYIDMIHDILMNFDERYATKEQKEELTATLGTINEKLYTNLKNIKDQRALDLNIDLKTIRDLIQSDF